MAIIRNSDGSVTVSGHDSASGSTVTIGGSSPSRPTASSASSESRSNSGSSGSGSSNRNPLSAAQLNVTNLDIQNAPRTEPTVAAEGAYTGDYEDPNRPPTPFEQLQSRSGSFYESSNRNYERIQKTATYNPEGLSRALDSPIDQPQVLKANLQQAYNVANERASQTASNRLLQQSAVGDLVNIGFLNTVPVVKDYTSSGNPIYQTDENGNVVQRLVVTERAKNLYEKEGYKGFYEFEEKAVFGKSLDFIVGPNDEVSIFPQGTRDQLKESGIEKPYFVTIDNREYLVAQKEGKNTIKVAAIDIYQNKVEKAQDVQFTELLDKNQYNISPNAELSYSLKEGQFNIEGTGISQKEPELPNTFKSPLDFVRPSTIAESPKQEINLLESVIQVGTGQAARDLGAKSSALFETINPNDIETLGGKYLYQTLRSADTAEKTVEGFELFASGGGGLEQLGGGLVAGIARTGLGIGETFIIGPATILGGSAATVEKVLTGKGGIADLQVYLAGQGFSASGLASSARDLPLFAFGDIGASGLSSKLATQPISSGVRSRISLGANFAIYETGREIYSNEPISAEKIAGAGVVGFALGGPFPVKIGDARLETPQGTTKIYKAVYLEPSEGKVVELVGQTEKGIVFGKPNVEQFPSLSKVVLPEPVMGSNEFAGPRSALETSILSSPEAMKVQGFTAEAIERTQITKEVLNPLKKQASAYGPFEFPKETATLTKEEVSAVLEYSRTQGQKTVSQVAGSFGAMGQRNPIFERVPQDIDIHVFGGPAEAEEFGIGATKALKDIGSDAIFNNEKKAITVRGQKALEIKSEIDPVNQETSFIKNNPAEEYKFGLKQNRASIPIEGLPTISLAEQSIRKGTASSNFFQSKTSFYSYLELNEKGIFEEVRSGRTKIAEPALHRPKDPVDFYADARTLAESGRILGTIPEEKVVLLESKLARYKELAFETPGVKEKFAELDASIAEKGVKVDYTSAVFDTPSANKFEPSITSVKINQASTFSTKSAYYSGKNTAREAYPSYSSSSNKYFGSYSSSTSSKSSSGKSPVSSKSPSPSIKSPDASPYTIVNPPSPTSISGKSSRGLSLNSPTSSSSTSVTTKSASLEFTIVTEPPPPPKEIKPVTFDFGIEKKERLPKKKRMVVEFNFKTKYTPSVAGISLGRKVGKVSNDKAFSGLEIRGVKNLKKGRRANFL